MNESLRRALLQAGLNEVDIAAHLQVDPKTVRRWLDGRTPYLRYRWKLAGLLSADEADLWPHLHTGASLPTEVRAIYPHLGAVPREVWLRLFGSAHREIGILAGSGDTVLGDPGIRAVLAERRQAGVTVRICLAYPKRAGQTDSTDVARVPGSADGEAAALTAALRSGTTEIRIWNGIRYAALYRADDGPFVSQCAYGVPDAQVPVVHLRTIPGNPLAAAHLDAFERTWSGQSLRRRDGALHRRDADR